MRGLVFKEIVVLSRWGVETNVWFYQKSYLAAVKRLECWRYKCEPFVIRSDEGLTLETSALESLYGGQITLSTQTFDPEMVERFDLIYFASNSVNEIQNQLSTNIFMS